MKFQGKKKKFNNLLHAFFSNLNPRSENGKEEVPRLSLFFP